MLSCRCWGPRSTTSLIVRSRAASSNKISLLTALPKLSGGLTSLKKSLKKGVAWRSRLERHWPEMGMACNDDSVRQPILFHEPGLCVGERQYTNGLTCIDDGILEQCPILMFWIGRFFGQENSSLFHELRAHVRSRHPRTKEQIPTTSMVGFKHGRVLSRLGRKNVTEPSVSNSCCGQNTTLTLRQLGPPVLLPLLLHTVITRTTTTPTTPTATAAAAAKSTGTAYFSGSCSSCSCCCYYYFFFFCCCCCTTTSSCDAAVLIESCQVGDNNYNNNNNNYYYYYYYHHHFHYPYQYHYYDDYYYYSSSCCCYYYSSSCCCCFCCY